MSHTHIYQGNVSGSLSLRVWSEVGGGRGCQSMSHIRYPKDLKLGFWLHL